MPSQQTTYFHMTSGESAVIKWIAALIAVIGAAFLLLLPLFLPSRPAHSQVTSSAFVMLSDGTGHGSGVHIGDGYILTAGHVAENAKTMTLKGSDGKSQTATTLWVNKTYDIALMRASKPEFLDVANLDCAANTVGQHVTAQGNPADQEFIYTSGDIVGAAREYGMWGSVVPVNITVIPGQSGGAAVDDRGDVVGVVVGVMTFSMGLAGIGYVVPAETVCMLLARK